MEMEDDNGKKDKERPDVKESEEAWKAIIALQEEEKVGDEVN